MPELVAWHVDRILNFYRKPPITSRIVPNKLLYPSFLTSLLPDFQVPVSVHGWIDKLEKKDPPVHFMEYLVTDHIRIPSSDFDSEYILQISDILVFDFLVDDPDRQAEKNWIMRENMYLSWDNGLGWNHGPVGSESCLDILCASNLWRRYSLTTKCKRACVFRQSIVDMLNSIGPNAG